MDGPLVIKHVQYRHDDPRKRAIATTNRPKTYTMVNIVFLVTILVDGQTKQISNT